MKPDLNLEIELSDKQIEFDRSLDEFDVTGYGGAKGGGKSAAARLVGLLRVLERPGTVAALFRRSYPEIKDNHLDKLFSQFPGLRDYYNGSEHQIRIPHLESVFKFRYCASLADVDRQAGREYHKLFIEEAGDWPYDQAMRLMRNTNRCTVPGIRASTAMLFNWGGVGHGWLRRVFYNRDLRTEEKKLSWNFILAKVEDNPKLMENDPEYLARLESEPNEALRRAYRHGDPNIVAGQFYTELTADVHLIDPFPIPPHWEVFGAYDYGYNHPACWQIWASDTDGNVYLVWELVKPKMHFDEQAALVKAHPLAERVGVWHAGHDCWTKKRGNDPTIAEEFLKYDLTLTKAKIDRVQGAAQVRAYLRYREVGGKREGPRAFIFKTCPVTFDCLSRMVCDPNRPEDVLKVDATDGDQWSGDDAFDTFKYALASRPIVSEVPAPPRGTEAWYKAQEQAMEQALIDGLSRQREAEGLEW
jgi:phage terminase large subunit